MLKCNTCFCKSYNEHIEAIKSQFRGENANHWDVEKSINLKSFNKGETNFTYSNRNSIDGLITENFES